MKLAHTSLKKWLIVICLTVVLVTLLAGCGEFSVSGRVLNQADGTGIPDADVDTTGNSTVSTKTNAEGYWTLIGLKGTAHIEARKNGWIFETSYWVDKRFKGDSLNFIGVQSPTYGISGRVVKGYNTSWGHAGATISFSGDTEPVTTDSGGYWSKDGLRGTVTVSVSMDGWTFTPASRVVSGPGTIDFTAVSFRVSGTVIRLDDGLPLPGVVLDCGVSIYSPQSDANGNWETDVPEGAVYITPKKPGWVFTPWRWFLNGPAQNTSFAAEAVTPFVGSMIAASRYSTAALKTDGTVWTWGNNTFGELGDGIRRDRITPAPLDGFDGAISIVASNGYFYLVLKNDGTVWGWGDNESGQLGDDTTAIHEAPTQIIGLTSVVAVAAGESHSVALKSDGTVWTWGENDWGQLGDGTTTDRSRPAQVAGLANVVAIAASTCNTIVLKNDGTVWAWGHNGSGLVGDGTNTNRHTPVQVASLSGVVAVAAGGFHAMAIKNDGTLWAWGKNSKGELGDGTRTNRNTPVQVAGISNVSSMAAGISYSVALKSDGTVWAWGSNEFGQFGDGTKTDRSTPIQVSGLSDVAAITVGGMHIVALKSDGTIWALGGNNFGELGDGTEENRLSPVQVMQTL